MILCHDTDFLQHRMKMNIWKYVKNCHKYQFPVTTIAYNEHFTRIPQSVLTKSILYLGMDIPIKNR